MGCFQASAGHHQCKMQIRNQVFFGSMVSMNDLLTSSMYQKNTIFKTLGLLQTDKIFHEVNILLITEPKQLTTFFIISNCLNLYSLDDTWPLCVWYK